MGRVDEGSRCKGPHQGPGPSAGARRQGRQGLTAMLLEHPLGTTPATYALAALMCFDAARLPARVDASGDLSSLFDQNRSQWDRELVAEGLKLLELSATG